ncbi:MULTISPECIES: hypothetical protein [unclassified Sphingomonas]|uniref:hypothetical protein n=1 Tax=unclassified Sphingomonas TaxID=196159 RepID=UPI000A7AF634|nr:MULTISPECIES: hypothetical protein [unclassified Sphingomonas]
MKTLKSEYASLGLFTVAGMIGILWLAPTTPILENRRFEDARTASELKQDISCQAKIIQKMPTEAARRKAVECSKEKEEQRLSTNDLIQQTRAADAAVAQTSLAAQGLWLSFVQALAAFITLVAAVAAALYARRASTSASDALDFEKARSSHVDRPWLSLAVSIVGNLSKNDKDETCFKIDVHIENIGSMPAHMVTTWVEPYLGTDLKTLEETKAKVATKLISIRARAARESRTLLPRKTMTMRAPQSIKMQPRYHLRALVYVLYNLPSGEEAMSWEVFEYECADGNGSFGPIMSTNQSVDFDKMRARPVGLTHSK